MVETEDWQTGSASWRGRLEFILFEYLIIPRGEKSFPEYSQYFLDGETEVAHTNRRNQSANHQLHNCCETLPLSTIPLRLFSEFSYKRESAVHSGPSGCGAGERVRDWGRKGMEQARTGELSVAGGIKT